MRSLLLLLAACGPGSVKVDDSAVEADADTDADSDTDTDADSDTDTDSDSDVDIDTDTDTDCASNAEVCDGVDNDCDGLVDGRDDDVVGASTWYLDADGDGHGTAGTTDVGCSAPPGYVADGDDCDDTDAAFHPDAGETCNGVDDDCDGLVDGQDGDVVGASTWYADADRDGYGDTATSIVACERPSGYVADGSDCDDTDAAAGGGTEVCDDIDNDCDGLVDGSDPDTTDITTWYADADGDGYGDPSVSSAACSRPEGYVANAEDCDDTDATAGGTEVCDDVDNDCDGLTDGQDDSLDGGTVWYADVDEDHYGDPSVTFFACNQPHGYVGNALDCDDTDAAAGACDVADDGTVCASLVGTDDGMVPVYTGDCDATLGFQSYGDHCYYAVTSTVNWPDARASCLAAGGYLATVGDSSENTFIQSLNARPHVGACDGDTEGTWTWITGEAFSYTSWSPGEPNDMGGEDCLEVAYAGGAWNDIWCSSNPYTDGYVCEF